MERLEYILVNEKRVDKEVHYKHIDVYKHVLTINFSWVRVQNKNDYGGLWLGENKEKYMSKKFSVGFKKIGFEMSR